MPVKTKCAHCSREAVLSDAAVGKNVRCKGCGAVIAIRPRAPVVASAETRTTVKPVKAQARPRPAERSDDDEDSQANTPQSSDRTLWVGLGAIGSVTVLASITVFLLIVNRQPHLPAVAQAAGSPDSAPNAKQAAPIDAIAKVEHKPNESPLKEPAVAKQNAAPKVDVDPSKLYGTQGNDPIAPAVDAPFAWMRARAEDSFYRLDNPRVEATATDARGVLHVHYRTEHRGNLVASHLYIQYLNGNKHWMKLSGDLPETGTIT